MSREGYGCLTSIISLIVVIALAFMMMSGLNSCTADAWNNGVCPTCEIRYELRGFSQGMKYYVCPECGLEVPRYFS